MDKTATKYRSRPLDIFHVVGDPTKRRILELTHEKEWCVNEMVAELHVSQPAISKHLRALRDAQLVDVRIDGQRRWYRLRADRLAPLTQWITPFMPETEAAMDALDQYEHQPFAGMVSGHAEVAPTEE